MAKRGDATLERGIQSSIIRKLNSDGRTIIRCRSADAAGHVVGDPDLYGSINGFHVEIEVKGESGVPTKKQWYELRYWASRGACCAVVTSVSEAALFQQEVLAFRGEGCILVFGKGYEQVGQGTHGAGPAVTFATIDGGHRYIVLVGPGA